MVGIVDLARAEGGARPDDLVTGRDERHAKAAEDGNAVAARRCDGGDLLRPETRAGRGDDCTLRRVLAGLAPVGAALQPGRDRDEVAPVLDVRLAILLHGNGVGARRHDRAGEDASRAPGRCGEGRGVARGDPRRRREEAARRAS